MVVEVRKEEKLFTVKTNSEEYTSKYIILAT
jgi:thioredoxin reductase